MLDDVSIGVPSNVQGPAAFRQVPQRVVFDLSLVYRDQTNSRKSGRNCVSKDFDGSKRTRLRLNPSLSPDALHDDARVLATESDDAEVEILESAITNYDVLHVVEKNGDLRIGPRTGPGTDT